MSSVATPRNRLLLALPPDELQWLHLRLEIFPLKRRRILHHAHLPTDYVYFVESGIVSAVANTGGGGGVEAWLIGAEGMTGIPVLLGKDSFPYRSIVQVEGSAFRLSTADLLRALDELPCLRPTLLHYVDSVLVQTAQAGACNARHQIPQRLARWLLMVHDRLGTDELPLTHNIISKMLGVRRASVTEALHVIVQLGAVSTMDRGVIRIRDRGKLEPLACNCYSVMKAEFDRLADSSHMEVASGERDPDNSAPSRAQTCF